LAALPRRFGFGAVLEGASSMLIAIIPFIVLIVGLLMYALAANPKISEIGRIMFFCGLLALCFTFARQTLSLG
jgi:Na+/phosphate symporter